VAGRIDRVGVTGAHVQLVTDIGFTATGRFVRFVREGDRVQAVGVAEQLLPIVIVQGAGRGEMAITNLPMQQVIDAGIKQDDWIVLADNNWPDAVQNMRLGRVASIGRSKRAILYAEIRLYPETGLLRLNDVWVMTKQH
jgi:hypothetical protein